MNNADFSIDSLHAIESCFMLWDLIFTLTRHTVFTDVLLPCMINATPPLLPLQAAAALKPSLYTDCFSNSDPRSHSGETE